MAKKYAEIPGTFKKVKEEQTFVLGKLYVSISSPAESPWEIQNRGDPPRGKYPGSDTLSLWRNLGGRGYGSYENIYISLTKTAKRAKAKTAPTKRAKRSRKS